MATRQQVYVAIDSERSYQRRKWGEPAHSNVEFLVYIQSYVNEALEYASRNSDPKAELVCQNNLRKIAALAVVAQEQNGVVFRET